MGCGAGKAETKADLPVPGVKYEFLVKKGGEAAYHWHVTDAKDTSRPDDKPWIVIKPSGNLKDIAGTVEVIGANKELCKVDVGAVDLKKVEATDKDKVDWWDGSWEDEYLDKFGEASILWGIGRTVSSDALNLSVIGHYSGVAKAWADTKDDAEATPAAEGEAAAKPEAKGDSDADCKGMSIMVIYGDQRLDVQHNFGKDLKDKDTESPMLALPELGVRASSKEGFKSATYTILVDDTAKDPVHSLLIGFILARYMHPKRAETRAADKAEEIAEDDDD